MTIVLLSRHCRDPAGAAAVAVGELDVPDPYHHGEPEYEAALTQIEAACSGLARRLVAGATNGGTDSAER